MKPPLTNRFEPSFVESRYSNRCPLRPRRPRKTRRWGAGHGTRQPAPDARRTCLSSSVRDVGDAREAWVQKMRGERAEEGNYVEGEVEGKGGNGMDGRAAGRVSICAPA